MAAAKIDRRKKDGILAQGRYGKAEADKQQPKTRVRRSSMSQGHGSLMKWIRMSERGVGRSRSRSRSTTNSRASFLLADKENGERSRKKSFTQKRLQQPLMLKIRKTCQQQGGVGQSTIKSQGGCRRLTRNSQMRNAPLLPVKCSVCCFTLNGSEGLKEHVRVSPICDIRNFILIKRCYVKIANGHRGLLGGKRGLDEASVKLDLGGGFISKQLYMEALGLELRGTVMEDDLNEEKIEGNTKAWHEQQWLQVDSDIFFKVSDISASEEDCQRPDSCDSCDSCDSWRMKDNLNEEKIEESTKACYEQWHQVDSEVSFWSKKQSEVVGESSSWTMPLLSSSWNLSSSLSALNTINIPSRFFFRSLSTCILNPKQSRW